MFFKERTVINIIDEILTFVNKNRILVKENVLFVKISVILISINNNRS